MTRIIAGTKGGQRLATPKGELTRPTAERVREALFSAIASWLGHEGAADDALAGIAFCDLYAGSGAIGLEALSRGADAALLVEKDGPTADLIRNNARSLKLRAEVRAAGVEGLVRQPAPRPFDIVWLDPPYAVAADAVDEVLANLVANGWLADSPLVVVERSSRGRAPDWPAPLSDHWQRRYGETTLHYATTGDA